MIIGVPKEIKLQEHRIGLTPESVKALTDVTLLAFDGDKIQDLLSEYPQVREAIMKLGLKRSFGREKTTILPFFRPN